LVEVNPPANMAPLPAPGGGAFYLDGQFQDNPSNLGCDYVLCSPYPEELYFAGEGTIRTGTAPAPSSAGGAGGAGTGGGGGADVPVFATYERQPPFEFGNRWFTNSDCSGTPVQAEPVIIAELAP
jgi:hypothetical protein